jgi:DNA-binding transcriptional regulator YdaS (Cro superfamily)
MTAYEYLKRHGKARADQLAKEAGVNAGYFNQVCNGHRHPSRKRAEILVKASKGRLTLMDLLFPPEDRINPARLVAKTKRHKSV